MDGLPERNATPRRITGFWETAAGARVRVRRRPTRNGSMETRRDSGVAGGTLSEPPTSRILAEGRLVMKALRGGSPRRRKRFQGLERTTASRTACPRAHARGNPPIGGDDRFKEPPWNEVRNRHRSVTLKDLYAVVLLVLPIVVWM